MSDVAPKSRHSRQGRNPDALTSTKKQQRQRPWIPAGAGRTKAGIVATALLLAACATQAPSAVNQAASTPGFLFGLWHGFIFPVAWVLSLVMPDVAVYAVPNNGGWYDFGYFVGIVFLGVGARSTRTVYVTRRIRR